MFGYAFEGAGNDPRDPLVAAAAVMFGGPVPMTVNPGAAAAASLSLQQTVPADTFANSAPFINYVTASSANVESTDLGVVGTVLNLAANVTDLDGAVAILSVTWSDNLGGVAGVNFVASGPLPTISAAWTPPAGFFGRAILTLAVMDPKLAQSSLTISVNVTKASTKGGPVTISATINNWPDVTDMSVGNGLVLPGLSTGFSASAIDPDGDAVTFAWSSNCLGTFAAGVGSGSDPVTGVSLDVVTFTAPTTTGPCTITVNVTDGKGGASSGQMAILVKQPLVYKPEFVTFYIAPFANPGQAVEVAVEAVQYNTALVPTPLPVATAYSFSGIVTPTVDTLYPATTYTGLWTVPATFCDNKPAGANTATLDVTATGTPANPGDPIPATTQTLGVTVTCP